jgi:large conductance mechanosensitive channel
MQNSGIYLSVHLNPKSMTFFKQFKEFAVKGNVLDLAVGVIIGAAFGKIVSSFISDVVMPPLGLLVGGVDVKHLNLVLKGASKDANGALVEAVTLNYGMFIQNVVDFTFIAFVIFVAIKGINRLKGDSEESKEKEVATPTEKLLEEIRDLLKK